MFFANSSASNPYRWTGDAFHVLAIIVLLVKFCVKRNSNGVSGKTQLLLALTYTARYMDLWGNFQFISYYNTILKVLYIAVSFFFVFLTYHLFKETYNKDHDSFRIQILIIPVTLLAFMVNHDNTLVEISWTWSIYMESVALVPQLYMIWKAKKSESYIILFLLCMAVYRGLYIANWVYRYNVGRYYDSIAIIGGIIETLVGLVGVLCVISQSLTNIFSSDSSSGNHYYESNSIYVIPLISNELKSKVDIVDGSTSGDDGGNGKSSTKTNSFLSA